jgi:putative heme iron utilization protein
VSSLPLQSVPITTLTTVVVIGTDCKGSELTTVVVIGTDCRGNELTTVVVIGTDCRGNDLQYLSPLQL